MSAQKCAQLIFLHIVYIIKMHHCAKLSCIHAYANVFPNLYANVVVVVVLLFYVQGKHLRSCLDGQLT